MDTENSNPSNLEYQEDISIFWKALSFLIPLAGIVIYFFQKNKGATLKAKSAITAAVAGMILNVLLLLVQSSF